MEVKNGSFYYNLRDINSSVPQVEVTVRRTAVVMDCAHSPWGPQRTLSPLTARLDHALGDVTSDSGSGFSRGFAALASPPVFGRRLCFS